MTQVVQQGTKTSNGTAWPAGAKQVTFQALMNALDFQNPVLPLFTNLRIQAAYDVPGAIWADAGVSTGAWQGQLGGAAPVFGWEPAQDKLPTFVRVQCDIPGLLSSGFQILFS